jgi:hypothetical protein
VSTLKKRGRFLRNVDRAFCIYIQGGTPCPPLRKGRQVQPKRRQDILYSYSVWKTVSPLRKGRQVQPNSSSHIYHTCCITSNNAILVQVTSHVHKLYPVRHTVPVQCENQKRTYRHRQRICPYRTPCQCRPRKYFCGHVRR